MGMSSSQARLLNLTSRMHQIEYKAAKLEAQKLQMANKSAHVYETYLDALESTKIQQKKLNPDGSVGFEDATYNKILEAGYYVQFNKDETLYGLGGPIRNGLIGISQADKDKFDDAKGNKDLFVAMEMNLTGATLSTAHNTQGYKEIYTFDQLKTMTGNNNYILMADINIPNDKTWSPNDFSGILDGNGHTINNLQNSLFKDLSGSVSNLILNANITATNIYGGALAQWSKGTAAKTVEISNVTVTGKVNNSTDSAGSLIGLADYTKISNITSSANVLSGAQRTGGIVGGATDGTVEVEDSIYSGEVESKRETTKNHCGGIIGETWASNTKISNCTSTYKVNSSGGTVSSYSAGGIIGLVNSGKPATITDCSSTAEVSTTPGDKKDSIVGVASSSTDISILGITGNAGAHNTINQFLDGGTNPTYREMFDYIANKKFFIDDGTTPADGFENNKEWLTNMINAGELYLYKKDENGNFYGTSVATDTNLQEVNDDSKLRKAEAQYEADMRKIDAKDRKYDAELAALDTERNAVKSEMETLKTVARENVERTFKLFS